MSAARTRSMSFRCSEPGCRESCFYEVSTRRDLDDLFNRYGGGKWKCLRHAKPDECLRPDNLTRETTLTMDVQPYGQFWTGEGFGSNGFAHGPGFKAFAEDFPPGTTLTITVRASLPASRDPGTPPIAAATTAATVPRGDGSLAKPNQPQSTENA